MKKKEHKVPMQDLGISKLPSPKDIFDWFHTKCRYGAKNMDESWDAAGEDGQMYNRGGSTDYAMPSHEPIEHGPVKEYTPEEIAEYEESRND